MGGANILGNLDCTGAELSSGDPGRVALLLNGADIHGDMLLAQASVNGSISLDGTRLGGKLDCQGATLNNPTGCTLIAANAHIAGSVSLNPCTSRGTVHLAQTKIDGNLDCTLGKFSPSVLGALQLSNVGVGGSISLIRATIRARKEEVANGLVSFSSVKVGGSLACSGATIDNPGQTALWVNDAEIHGDVLLNGKFASQGTVWLLRAKIAGNFACDGGSFTGGGTDSATKQAMALALDEAVIRGDVDLTSGFFADGIVQLSGATVDGRIRCRGGRFNNPEGVALMMDDVRVGHSLLLNEPFESRGAVRLSGAVIGGDVECYGGAFINPSGGMALMMERINVGGSVRLNGSFQSDGAIDLSNATVNGNVECRNAVLRNPYGEAITLHNAQVHGDVCFKDRTRVSGTVSLKGATVQGDLTWSDLAQSDDMALDLRRASVRLLNDDEKSWPKPGQLYLEGLEYQRIPDNSPLDVTCRLRWLALQPRQDEEGSHLPLALDSYTQLAAVYHRLGREDDARTVLIQKDWDSVDDNGFGWHRLFNRFAWATIGYGQTPWRLGFWICGALLGMGLILRPRKSRRGAAA